MNDLKYLQEANESLVIERNENIKRIEELEATLDAFKQWMLDGRLSVKDITASEVTALLGETQALENE